MFKTVMTDEQAGKRVNRLENAKAERLLIDAAKAPQCLSRQTREPTGGATDP